MAPIYKNPPLNLERARSLFKYDSITGRLVCIKSEGRRRAGFTYKNYGTILVDGVHYKIHRLIWFIEKGEWPKELLDHKDRNHKHNKLGNLREATYSQNQYNKIQVGATGYPGVTKRNRPKPYLAKIRVEGKRINLGSFYTAEEAAEAYRQAKAKYHGEFSPLEPR